MAGLKDEWLKLMNIHNIIGDEFPEYIAYQQQKIYNILEDVHSVSTTTELQEAIDSIGTGAGTIFIASGTYIISTPIDIDGCGSLVIYGHGDNTILKPADGVTVFNITCTVRCLIRTLKIDVNDYTFLHPNTQAVIVNETNNNIVMFEDVTIDGDGSNGIGIELQSNNCYIDQCNIIDCKKGIYINGSDRHTVSNNIMTGHADYGIHADSVNYLTITTNTCGSNGDHGIFLDTITHSTISGNICNSNAKTGIYCDSSDNNTIASNNCSSNSENGIYITESSYNTISGNTLSSNDSNSILAKAGLYITTNSDYNTISGNTVNDNNNVGLGTGYGIYIATPTCEENVVAANNANGNDIDWKDAGLRTTIKYYVQTEEELQDAIDSISTGAGTIVITIGVLTLSATINVDGGGFYIIEGEGEGTVIDCGADRTAFNITSAVAGTTLRNFKIDANSLTSLLKEIINVNEGSNNKIVCENLTITGDGTHGLGISLSSDNCLVTNCFFEKIKAGVFTSNSANNIITENICKNNDNGINNYFGSDCIINGNVCSNNTIGIFNDRSTNSTIVENTCNHNERYGIYNYGSSDCTITGNACNGNNTDDVSDGAGIQLTDNCDYNTIVGNSCNNNANIGAGTAYGININTVDCNNNVIGVNSTQNNDVDYNDTGTGTKLFGDDTIYGISWDNDLGTATKNAIYDKIQLVIGGAAANAFKTITGITNDVIADGVADILNLAAVGGLTIVGTTLTDTITFTNTITQYTDILAVAAIVAADPYIVNNANDIMNGDLTVNNLITAGNVDGVDVSALKIDVDGFNDELKLLTQVEIQQLENIGAELISAAEWSFVASLQDVASGASPTFNRITINNIGTVNSDAVRYDQLVSMIAGLNWQESVIDNDLNAPPGGEGVGDRYIVAAGGAGAWNGHDDDIAEYNGVGWDFTTPVEGFTVWVKDEDTNFTYNGAAWVEFGSTVSHNNTTGLQGGVAGEYFHLTNAQHGALHATYTDAMVDARIVVQNTNPAGTIDIAIDALINTHNVADNHIAHSGVTITAGVGLSGGGTIAANRTIDCDITQYTDVMTQAVITAQLVDGQSIDNRIDALIAGLVNAAGAVAAVEATGIDFDTTKTLGFVDDAVGVFIDRIYDEDDMVSDDEHGLATQQSIKKYSDDRLYDIGFSHNWGGIVDQAPTVDKVYDQFIEVANEMTAIKYCLNFQGDWNATLGAAPHAAPADGDYWIVTTAGNWDGVDWDLLDWIVWEDNSEKWYKVKYFRQLPKVIVKATDSIQTAIDKVIHMGGGTVEIQSATFNDGNDAFPLNINDAGAGLFLRIVGIGISTIIDPNGDTKIFNITNIGRLVLEDFKIDITDYVTAALECIDVSEANDNLIIINNVSIVGDGTNGIGIEVNSNNCKIENCNISSINIGINVLGNDNTVQGNTISSCNTYGVQIKGDKNSLYDNESDSNAVGIYLDTGDYNQINGNYVEGNMLNGIYLSGSSYNAINDNYCIGNDSNTANPQAGIFIDADSDNNNIISNTSINNNNIGAGEGYGIYIGNANCIENIVHSNNCSGNDVQWKDIGTNSDFEYRCSTNAEIQNAIDSIAGKSGIVHIVSGTILISTTIDVDGSGDYIIEGEGVGSILETVGDISCFNITDTSSCFFNNFKIDTTSITTGTKPVIDITETSNNPIAVENITFVGNGYGIKVNSNTCKIESNIFEGLNYGIYLNSNILNTIITSNRFISCSRAVHLNAPKHTLINDNNIYDCVCGMWLDSGSNFTSISNNIFNSCTSFGIYSYFDGYYNVIEGNIFEGSTFPIYLSSYGGGGGRGCHYCVISNNNISDADNTNYALYIQSAYACTIVGNVIDDCDDWATSNFGAIHLATCFNCSVVGNSISNCNNTHGSYNCYGIFLQTCTSCKIIGNSMYQNDVNSIGESNGTGNILFGDDTVFGADWDNNLGTPTKNAVYDAINVLFPIGAKIDYFGLGIKGVIATRDYEISIANGDDFDMKGWFVANSQAGTPDCINKFIRNEATSGVVGGSDDAVVVQHSHGIPCYVFGTTGLNLISDDYTGIQQTKYTNDAGVSGVGKNIPAKISAIPIIKMS